MTSPETRLSAESASGFYDASRYNPKMLPIARLGLPADVAELIASRAAELVVERLRGSGTTTGGSAFPRAHAFPVNTESADATWVDAGAVARHLGVERDYVYEHAAELGARSLGRGPKARLRFRLSDVDGRLPRLPSRGSEEGESPAKGPVRARRKRRSLGTSGELLPIRGRSGSK